MKSRKLIALFLAAVLVLQMGLAVRKSVQAEIAEATHLQVAANPQEAVLGATAEILSTEGYPNEITLKFSALLNTNYLDDRINGYSKDYLDVLDLGVPLTDEPSEGGSSEGGSDGTGETGTGEAGTEETGTGETGTDETGTGEAGTEETGTGETGTEETGTGETGTGETETGELKEGETEEGETEEGGAEEDETETGETGTGETGTGTTETGATEDNLQQSEPQEGESGGGGGGGGGGSTVLWGRQALDLFGSEQEIRAELDSLPYDFPQITYSVKLDGEVFESVRYQADFGVVFSGQDEIGTFVKSTDSDGNIVLEATLDSYVYYLAPSSVDITVFAKPYDTSAIGRIISGTAIDGDVFSLIYAQSMMSFGLSGFVKMSNIMQALYDTEDMPYEVDTGTTTVTIDEPIFNSINLGVSMPQEDVLQFELNSVFNEEFLFKCFEAVQMKYDAPGLPELSFKFSIDTNDMGAQCFEFDTDVYSYITSTQSGNSVEIGEIAILETAPGSGVYDFYVQFYPNKIYGAIEASGNAVFTATLTDETKKGSEPLITVGGSGDIIIDWKDAEGEDNTQKPQVNVEKTGPAGEVSDPYLQYTLEFSAADDLSDLRYLTIVDDLKRYTDARGLHLLGFDYEITMADGSTVYSSGIGAAPDNPSIALPLNGQTSSYDSYGQPFLYSKTNQVLAPGISADAAPSDELIEIMNNLTEITKTSSSDTYYENGETFVMGVGALLRDKHGLQDDTDKVTNVKVTLYTMLDAKAYAKYMSDSNSSTPASSNLTFKNEALGFYNDTENKSKVSGESGETKVNFTYFKKVGDLVTKAGKNQIQYTIDAATYFMNSNGDAYIVDKINSDNHMLLQNENNKVTFKGQDDAAASELTVVDLTSVLSEAEKKAYADLQTIDELNAFWSVLDSKSELLSAGGSSTQAAVYTYGDEQIIIFRIGYSYLNKPVQIKYTTQVNTDISFGTRTVTNEAKIFVGNKYIGGHGPGVNTQAPIGTVDKKTTSVNYKIANKASPSWSGATQLVSWKIEINTARENLQHVILVDEIDLSEIYPTKIGSLTMDALVDGATFTTTVPSDMPAADKLTFTYVEPDVFNSDYFWETTPPLTAAGNRFTYDTTSEPGKGLLKLYINNVSAYSYFTITTKVVDSAVLAGNKTSVKNILDAWCWDGTNPKTQNQIEVISKPSFNKIDKYIDSSDTKNYYDYSDGTTTWNIRANYTAASPQPIVHIKNVVMTDFLPPEHYLSEVSMVKYKGNEYSVSPSFAFSDKDTADSVTFALTPLNGAPDVDFKLKVVAEASKPYAADAYNIVRFIVTDLDGNQNYVIDGTIDITIKTKFKESYKKVTKADTNTPYTNYVTIDGIIGQEAPDGSFTYPETGTIAKPAGDPLTVDNITYYNAKPDKAKDKEATSVTPLPLSKSAKYDSETYGDDPSYKGPDTLHWTVLVNRELYGGVVTDDGRAIVKDIINPTADGKNYFLLKTDTMKVSTVTLNPSGGTAGYVNGEGDVYNAAAGKTPAGVFSTLDENGFEFVLPQNQVYEIKFDVTIITNDTLKFNQLKNKATISYPDGREAQEIVGYYKNSTSTAHTYASISYIPHIYVVKSHKGTSFDYYTKIPETRLAGVTFTLKGYTYTRAGGIMTIDYNNEVYSKTGVTSYQSTSETGGSLIATAMFPLYKRENVVYILEETDLGSNSNIYAMDALPRYIIVGDSDGDITPMSVSVNQPNSTLRKNAVVEVISTNVKAVYFDSVEGTSIENSEIPTHGYITSDAYDDKYYATFAVFDSVKDIRRTTSIEVNGTKRAVNLVTGKDNLLAYALFGLYDDYDKARDPSDGGIDHAYSNISGLFRFDNLAPEQTYYIRELTQPGFDFYDMSDMIGADGKINPQKIITFETPVNPASGTEVITTDIDGNAIEIVNIERIPVGQIIGYKEDTSGEPLAGAQFGLYSDNKIIAVAVSKMAGGRAEFSFNDIKLDPANMPFVFTVREINPPSGYDKTSKVYTVRFDGSNPTIALEVKGTDTKGAEILFVNSPTLVPFTPLPLGPSPDIPIVPPGGGGGGGGTPEDDEPDTPDVPGTPSTPNTPNTPSTPSTPSTPPSTPSTPTPVPVVTPPVEPEEEQEPEEQEPAVAPEEEQETEIEPEEVIAEETEQPDAQPGEPAPTPAIVAPTPPSLADVPEEEILHPAQLPEGYSAVEVEEHVYIIYDDEDIPLGYVVIPEDMTLDEISIMDELIPFGMPEFSMLKENPVTGDLISVYILALAVLTVVLLGVLLILKKKFNRLNKIKR